MPLYTYKCPSCDQTSEVLQSMKPIPKILNTDKELFTAEQYKDAMNSHLGYEQTERTAFNWIKKLMVLGVIKRVKKNQYEPLWETLEDTISS